MDNQDLSLEHSMTQLSGILWVEILLITGKLHLWYSQLVKTNFSRPLT